jgi:hypothetical protein
MKHIIAVLAVLFFLNSATSKAQTAEANKQAPEAPVIVEVKPAPAPSPEIAPTPVAASVPPVVEPKVARGPEEGERAVNPGTLTEFFYQAPKGKYLIEAAFNYAPRVSYSFYTKPSGAKSGDANQIGASGTALYEYGLTDRLAIGIQGGYAGDYSTVVQPNGTTTNLNSFGITDIHLGLLGFVPEKNFNFHYGLLVGISPSQAQQVSSFSDGNEFSGGFSFLPNIGISIPFERHILGIAVSANLLADRSSNDGGSPPQDQTIKRGNSYSITGLYEYHLNGFEADTQFGFTSVDAQDTVTASGTTTADSHTYSTLEVGVQDQVCSFLNLRLQYSLFSYPGFSTSSTLSQSGINESVISARLRFEF